MENTNLKCSFTLKVPGSMNKLCEVTHVPGGSAVATGIDRNCRGLHKILFVYRWASGFKVRTKSYICGTFRKESQRYLVFDTALV